MAVAAVEREAWLRQLSARGTRPDSAPRRPASARPASAHARHVAEPTVGAAAEPQRPASARPPSAGPARQPRAAVGGVFVRAQRWAQDTRERGPQPPRQRPQSAAAATARPSSGAGFPRRKLAEAPSAYRVRQQNRVSGAMVGARQTLTPRLVVDRPVSARPRSAKAGASAAEARPPAAAAVQALTLAATAGQPPQREVAFADESPPAEEDMLSPVLSGRTRVTAAEEEIVQLRDMLGISDGQWAWAPDSNSAPNGTGTALSGARHQRLLMPTWAKLAERVELMQAQNREAERFLGALTETANHPLPWEPGPTPRVAGSVSGASALPVWPDAGPIGDITPTRLCTGWRGPRAATSSRPNTGGSAMRRSRSGGRESEGAAARNVEYGGRGSQGLVVTAAKEVVTVQLTS